MTQQKENNIEQRTKPVVAFSLDKVIIAKIDENRKTIPRSTFVNYILHEYFKE